MTKYQTEPSCELLQTIIDAIDILPKEQQYPTIRAIFCKRCGHPMEDYNFENVDKSIFYLAIGYQGVKTEEWE